MKISEKYIHIGYSYPGVSKGWVPIVEDTIAKIEKTMWPSWIPMFIKRYIHKKATGNSVVKVESLFWYKIRNRLTKGQMITDIKNKFATLRIYGDFGDKIKKIIEESEKKCLNTCETCSSTYEVRSVNYGWIYNLCKDCRSKKKVNKKSNPKSTDI
jgi:hypothetical protein